MSYEVFGEPDDSPYEAAIEAGWIDPDDVSKALIDVMNERDRQENEEHFAADRDDGYVKGELAQAAASYTVHSVVIASLRTQGLPVDKIEAIAAANGTPRTWPWAPEWWKPGSQRRNLVKAAALLVAEIERLDRAAGAK